MDDVLLRPRPRARFPATNVALFVATLATTLWAGFTFSPLADRAPTVANVFRGGLPFAASLVAILFTHEMGHYVLARRYRVKATLPYFIPVPFGFGTLGAVIRMRSAIPSRRATLDIGAAGPLAGLVVAVPLYVLGLALSEVKAVPAFTPSPLLSPLSIVHALVAGHAIVAPPSGATVFGESLLTWAARRLVVGPLPAGHDLVPHPIMLAAWLGILVTTLNLVPAGQLDGGHVLYALLGRRRALAVSRAVSAALLAAGFCFAFSWLLWWFLTRFVVGLGHPPAVTEEPLDPRRRAIAWLSLALFLATFMPVPVSF